MKFMNNFAGIVLAAGFGTRLRPFTDNIPKPLVPLLNKTPLWHQIMLLKKSGIRRIFVNLHYIPDRIKAYISREFCEIDFTYEPVILGTGGGIKNIIKHYKIDTPVIILNGDTVTNVNINEMIEFFSNRKPDALMLLKKDNALPDINAVFADNHNQVRFIKETPPEDFKLKKLKFMGVHILSPESFDFLPENGCINKIMYPALIKNSKKVSGFITNKDSPDIGTPESLFNTNFELIKLRLNTLVFSKSFISGVVDANGNIVGYGCNIKNSLLRNCIIGENCNIVDSRIEYSLILPDSLIERKSLKRCVANTKYRYIIHNPRR